MKKKADAKGGQILVLMAMLSTTLIIMFGMVVSVGHLVEAKINLQNAVDLASMSGASWQARFLNHLSLINYRMRQNYKFVLYDLYVTQSRFNRGLVQALATQTSKFDRIPANQPVFGICQQAFGYTPKVGVDEDSPSGSTAVGRTNLCQNVRFTGNGQVGATIPPILTVPTPSINPVLIAASIAILRLGERVREICGQSSGQNKAYLGYIMRNLTARQQFQIDKAIEILQEWENAFSADDGGSLGAGRADQTILATFRRNLIGANSRAVVEYLNPSRTRAFRFGGTQANTVKSQIVQAGIQGDFADYFQRQFVHFKVRFADFRDQAGGCATFVTEQDFPQTSNPTDPQGVLLGLSRARVNGGGTPTNQDPVKIPFNIVLRATVRPKLLFWPQSFTPTLVAVGAAKPFGSRMGPPVLLSNLETVGANDANETVSSGLANMSFYPGDLRGSGASLPGLGHKKILSYLLSALPSQNSGQTDLRPSVIRPSNLDCLTNGTGNLPFMCASLAPTLYEGFFWNAFPYYPIVGADPAPPETLAVVPNDFAQILDPPADLRYNLLDRMPAGFASSQEQLRRWHYTVLIGNQDDFRDNGKPAFFADSVSVSSSWTPDIPLQGDELTLDPTAGVAAGGNDTTGKTRLGYQIKLVSLPQVCREIRAGGQVDPGPLTPYCEGGTMKVFY